MRRYISEDYLNHREGYCSRDCSYCLAEEAEKKKRIEYAQAEWIRAKQAALDRWERAMELKRQALAEERAKNNKSGEGDASN